jgi:AraC-like DNA-binding protein
MAVPMSLNHLTSRNLRQPAVGVHTLRLSDLYQRAASASPQAQGQGTGTSEQYARHRVPVHLLALVTAGRASFSVDFETYPCRPGGLLWVRPGQFVGFPPPGIDATLVLFEPHFPYDAVGVAAIGPRPGGGGPHAVARPARGTYWQPGGEDSEAIVDGISQLEIDYQRLVSGDDIAVGVLRHQLAALLLRLSRLEPEGGPDQGDSEVLARFRTVIDEHFALTRQVEEYARQLGCSVRTLTRASLAATGRTAKQLVDDRVALEAKRLLADSDLPVADVAARLGFSEATNFGRFFARTVGSSPGSFRAAALAAARTELVPESTPPAQPLVAALSKAGVARGSPPPAPEDIPDREAAARRTRRA